MLENRFRFVILVLTTAYVFEKVDFDPPKPDAEKPEVEAPEVPESKFPDFEIPGIKVPTPGFNWQTFNFAKTNPDLFFRIMKKIIKEVSLKAAEKTGEALDPRNIDFQKFKDGFNLTDINPDIVTNLKEYLLEKIRLGQKTIEMVEAEGQNLTALGQKTIEMVEAEGQNLTAYRNLEVTDVELTNITWNGQIHGRIRVLDEPADYYYSSTERAVLFAAVALGAILFLIPLTRLIDRWGTRKTFTLVGVISAIATGLVPVAASLGFVPFVIVRVIQGVGFAACFPVVGSVTSAWAKLSENGLFNGALTGFLQLGPVIAMPISGFFCHLDAWELTYYVHALLTIFWILIFWFVFRDTPSEHKKVTTRETNEIQAGKVVVDGRSKHNRTKTPCLDIYKSKSVIAIWVAAIGNMGGIFLVMFAPIFIRQVLRYPVIAIYKSKSVIAIWVAAIGNMGGIFLVMFAPIFIRQVLRYPVIAVGFQAALPTLLQFIVKLKAGAISDYIKLPETTKVKIFNSIAFFGMATFFILIALIASEETQVISIVFLVASATILGFNTGGFFKAATLVGRHYSFFVNAHVQLIAFFEPRIWPIDELFLTDCLFSTGMFSWLVFVISFWQLAEAGRTSKLPSQYEASCYEKCHCNATTFECRDLHEIDTAVFRHALPKVFPNLDTISITGNDFGIMPADNIFGQDQRHLKLTMLDLSDNGIRSFFAETFFGVPRVEYLYLRNNEIESVGDKPLNHLSALRLLDLSAAFGDHVSSRKRVEILQNILDADHKFKHLEELILSNNDFAKLDPSIFCHIEGLDRLILTGNALGAFPIKDKCLPGLRLLDLRSNKFSVVSPTIWDNLESLNTLDVSNNPLVCDCSNQEFIKFANEDRNVFLNQQQTTCAGPANFAGKDIFSLENQVLCQKSRSFHWIVLVLLAAGVLLIYRHLRRSGRLSRFSQTFGYSQLKHNDEANPSPAFV
uniref:Major facilitator superfamily (MFS) profile domain-containing protein n=1 Tax=Panagrolaimus sp. JU765 TaxID=591449 RepID=A0AC34R549_9BILA